MKCICVTYNLYLHCEYEYICVCYTKCYNMYIHRSSHATQSALTLHSGHTTAFTDDLKKLLVYKGMISTEVRDMRQQLQNVTVRPSKKPAQNSTPASSSTRGAVRLGLGQVVDLGYVDDPGLAQVMSWANSFLVCMSIPVFLLV